MNYTDSNVLPGKFYTYRVEVYKEDGTPFRGDRGGQQVHVQDENSGFITYNGLVAGNIKTQSEILVEGVKVTVVPESGKPLGSALRLNRGKSHIQVQNIKDLNHIEEAILVEFWYKKGPGTGGENRILTLDEVQVSEYYIANKLEVLYNQSNSNAQQRMYVTVPDREWHHYAIALGTQGGQIYIDGQKQYTNNDESQPVLGQNTTEFTPIWKTGTMQINSVVSNSATLDELRIWDIDRLSIDGNIETDEAYQSRIEQQIAQNYDIQLSGKEKGLLLYYRFDEGAGNIVHDIAKNPVERVLGEAVQFSEAMKDTDGRYLPIEWANANEQPNIYPGAYTDVRGHYSIGAINYGASTNFVVTPQRPDYTFAPDSKIVYLQRSLERRGIC